MRKKDPTALQGIWSSWSKTAADSLWANYSFIQEIQPEAGGEKFRLLRPKTILVLQFSGEFEKGSLSKSLYVVFVCVRLMTPIPACEQLSVSQDRRLE